MFACSSSFRHLTFHAGAGRDGEALNLCFLFNFGVEFGMFAPLGEENLGLCLLDIYYIVTTPCAACLENAVVH